MHASWEPSIEAVAAAMEKYEKIQKSIWINMVSIPWIG